MNTFTIQETEGGRRPGILIPLSQVLEKIDCSSVKLWALRDIEFTSRDALFGVAVPDIERMSSALSHGLYLAGSDFSVFIKIHYQILEGYIEAYQSVDTKLFSNFCHDTTLWEITTSDPGVTRDLCDKGYTYDVE